MLYVCTFMYMTCTMAHVYKSYYFIIFSTIVRVYTLLKVYFASPCASFSAATPQSFGLSHMLSPVPTFAKYFFPSPVRCLSHPSGNSPIESNF